MRTLSPPWRRVLVGSWIMIAVLSVALLTLYVDNKRTRDCIAKYMVADQKASAARAEVAEEERQAFKATLTIIFVRDSSREEREKAGLAYIALLNKNDQVRKDNPVPPVPTNCS